MGDLINKSAPISYQLTFKQNNMQTQGSYQFGGGSNNPLKGLVGIAAAIFFFIALFWFMKFLFNILWFLLPVMLIATAIIDYKVILDYLSWLGRLFKSNMLSGILVGALTLIGAPVVALFLLGKALLKKKVKTMTEEVERRQEGEYVNYEEVESEILELPQIEMPKKEPKSSNNNNYEDLFNK